MGLANGVRLPAQIYSVVSRLNSIPRSRKTETETETETETGTDTGAKPKAETETVPHGMKPPLYSCPEMAVVAAPAAILFRTA